MTEEDDFQAALDLNPEDWQTRLVFSDWLEERGDERAAGYRALGAMRLRPQLFGDQAVWDGRGGAGCWLGYYRADRVYPPQACLPADWFDAIGASSHWFFPAGGVVWPPGVYPRGFYLEPINGFTADRRAVDEVAVRAFLTLPADRRAELLKGATGE